MRRPLPAQRATLTAPSLVIGSLALAGLAGLAACGGSSKKDVAEPPLETTEEEPPPEESPDDAPPDDGMAVEGMLGEISAADVRPVIEPRMSEIQSCHASHTGEQRFVGGRAELLFRVNLDGTVKSVKVVRGDLGSWPIEKCVLAIAGGLTLPRPKGGEGEVTFPMEFPSRGNVTPLDPDRAQAEVEEELRKLSCKGSGAGVAITLYVGPGGVVKAAGFSQEAGAFDPAWADCAHKKILRWKLTDPQGTVWKLKVRAD